MKSIKKFKINRKNLFIGIAAIVFLSILIIFQKLKPYPATQSPSTSPVRNEHSQQVVQFFTDVIGSQSRTKVFIPFSFKADKFPLVLAYKLEDQSMREMLIFHPQISTLDWSSIIDGEITLYQKVKKYDSIDEFLESPSGNIAAESSIKEKHPHLDADLIHFSNDNPIDLEKYDFILSTQTSLSRSNVAYYYENIIDTRDALLNEDGQITWIVRAPDADETHLFYLGNIDIVYLQ